MNKKIKFLLHIFDELKEELNDYYMKSVNLYTFSQQLALYHLELTFKRVYLNEPKD
jgi:hypothetical protein